LRLSIIEGMAFALMVGVGETFFLADATRLAGSRLQQGLVVTLPLFAGAVGQVLNLFVLARIRSRRPLVVAAALGQALVLAGLAYLSGTGRSTPEILIAAATLAAIFGQSGAAAWSSWFGDLVPAARRGRYFGRRNRFIYATTFAGVLLGGQLLQQLEPGGPAAMAMNSDSRGGSGFAVIYAIAALARALSAALHARTPEPRFGGLPPRSRTFAYFATEQGRDITRLVSVGALFYLTVYIASPYFTPYMLEDLGFEYWQYMVVCATLIVAKVAFLSLWGRSVDHRGARPSLLLAALLTSIIPLPFLWADGLGWVLAAQAFSGVAWGGYELSMFTLMLGRTYRRVRPQVFALQGLANGTAQLVGSLLGALAVSVFSAKLVWLFALSFAGRFAVALIMPRAVREVSWETPVPRGKLSLRVAGFRVSGGLGLRPVPEADVENTDEGTDERSDKRARRA